MITFLNRVDTTTEPEPRLRQEQTQRELPPPFADGWFADALISRRHRRRVRSQTVGS